MRTCSANSLGRWYTTPCMGDRHAPSERGGGVGRPCAGPPCYAANVWQLTWPASGICTSHEPGMAAAAAVWVVMGISLSWTPLHLHEEEGEVGQASGKGRQGWGGQGGHAHCCSCRLLAIAGMSLPHQRWLVTRKCH